MTSEHPVPGPPRPGPRPQAAGEDGGTASPAVMVPADDRLVQEVTDQLGRLSIRMPASDDGVADDVVDLAADLAVVQSVHDRLQQRLSGIGS